MSSSAEQLGLPGVPAPRAELWREHTAERWKRDDPEGYAECVELIKQGHGNVSRLAKRFGRSKQSVRALRNAEFSVEQLEAIIAKKGLEVAADSLERQSEVIGDATARDLGALAMASKAGLETSKQARGQSLHLHEHLHLHVDTATAAERLKAKARKMDLEAGKIAPLPAPSAEREALDLPIDSTKDNKATVESGVIIDSEHSTASRDTLGDTAADIDATKSKGGGGGSPRAGDAAP